MSISFDLKQAPQDMSRDLHQLSNFFELPKRGSISLTISKDYPVQVPISKLLHQQQQQNQMFMAQNSYNNLINNVKQQQNQTEQKPKKNNNNLIDINAAEVVEEVKISKDDQSMISENKDTSKQEQPNQDNIVIQEVPLNYMNSMDQFITNLICQDTKKFVSDQKSNKWLCHGNLGFNNNNNNLNQDYNKFVMGGGGSLSIPMPGQNGSLALFQQHNIQNQYNNQINQPQQQQQYQQFMIQNLNQQDNNGQENYNNNGNNLQSFSQLQQQSYTNQLNPNYYMQQNNENQYGINNNKNQQNKQFSQIDYNPINFQNQYNNNNNQNNFQSHIQQNEYFQQYNYNNMQNIQNQNNNNSNNNNNGNFGFQNQSFQHNDISSFNQQITNMNNNNNHINNNQNNGSNNQMAQQLTQQQIYFQQAIQSPNLKVNNPNLADYENSINIFLPVLHNNKLSSEIQYKQEDKQYGEHQNNDMQYKNSANTNNDPSLFYQPPQQDYQEENENDKELSNNLSLCNNNNNNNKNNEIEKGNFQTKNETQKEKEKINSLNTNINNNINSNINKKQDNEIPAKSENNDKNAKEKNNLQLKKNGEDTRLNTSHVPINMLNNLIRYMIPIYQLKIPCTCQVNKEKCSRCIEFQTIQDLKKQRCKNIQSFGQFWAHKRIRLLSEHYFIEMGPFQIQAKNYRSVNNRQALYKCMPAFLDGVRNHKLFWKLI